MRNYLFSNWRTLLAIVWVVVAATYICACLEGCSALPPFNSRVSDCETHPSGWCTHNTAHKAESWDQENLKRHDSGCPTAIFDAPNGNLRLCPTT